MRPIRHIRNIWLTIPVLRGTCESQLTAAQMFWAKSPHGTKQIVQDVSEYSECDHVLFTSFVTFRSRWQEVCYELNPLSFGEPWEMKPWWFVNNLRRITGASSTTNTDVPHRSRDWTWNPGELNKHMVLHILILQFWGVLGELESTCRSRCIAFLWRGLTLLLLNPLDYRSCVVVTCLQ